MDRPVTTLFMLMSVDGKISTGMTDEMDVDRDFPRIAGVREGLHQYYEIEQTTDLWSFNTGRVQAKMGVNTKEMPTKTPVSFVLLDNRHLSAQGVRYFCARSRQFVLITTNREHPAFSVREDNLHVILQEKLSLPDALKQLKQRTYPYLRSEKGPRCAKGIVDAAGPACPDTVRIRTDHQSLIL